jgi:DNA polymerase epsilon subunit 3
MPDNIKLQKETVLSLVKGSTVFINYLGGPPLFFLFISLYIYADYILKLLRAFIDSQKIRVLTRSLFLCFSAHDVALSKQHKSISASDVLKALEILEFTDMVEDLQGELQSSYFLFF